MSIPQDASKEIEELRSKMRAAVKEHWKAFLIEGILLVILGLAAMIVPPLASLAVTIFLGWMFLISGIGGLVVTYWARHMPGFWWSLISAALAVLAGGILLARPVQGVLTLTIVVSAYFLAEGVTTIMYALEHRGRLSDYFGPAGLGGMGDRASGRHQPVVRRRDADRHGACRAPHNLTVQDLIGRRQLFSVPAIS